MQHGDDYLSYSDDLVKAMSKSTDNVDTMMKLVSDFGDTAENAIVKSGDHAVDIYERFGENGLKAVANYGDDAVMLINRHGEDVIDIINTHGNTAVLIVENYGDDAIKAIKNGIEPTNINKLVDEFGINPHSYEKRGIKNNKAANQVLNSQFTAKKISSVPSFSDTCESVVRNNGFNTVTDFKSTIMKSYRELDEETFNNVIAIRNSIPDPTNDTVMQKVINPNYLDSYFEVQGQYSSSVSGSLAKLSDVQDLKTYTEVYNGLRLDYKGTPFVNPGTDNATMYAIRFTSDETQNNITKSVVSEALGNANWEPPYTGTGFISSAEKLDFTNFDGINNFPAKTVTNGNKCIPEYIAKNGVSLENGAEMYKITESGEEILYAVYDRTDRCFKKIGD